MNFTPKELALLNRIISIALLNGEIELNEVTQSVCDKVANEICRVAAKQKEKTFV